MECKDEAQLIEELRARVQELERRESVLTESLRRADSLAANIPVGVYRFRRQSQDRFEVEYISERACSLTGVTRKEVLEDPFSLLDSSIPRGCGALVEAALEAFETCAAFAWEGEVIVGSEVRTLRFEMAPDASCLEGSLIYNGTVVDMTKFRRERESREKLLAEASHMKLALVEFLEAAMPEVPAVKELDSRWASLSCQEMKVAGLLLQGLSNKELAAKLDISESTVKKHVNAVFHKLGVASRAELFHLDRRRA